VGWLDEVDAVTHRQVQLWEHPEQEERLWRNNASAGNWLLRC
jgi:hypothetical protein